VDSRYRRDYGFQGSRGRDERWTNEQDFERSSRGRYASEDWEPSRGSWDRGGEEWRGWGSEAESPRRFQDEDYRYRGEYRAERGAPFEGRWGTESARAYGTYGPSGQEPYRRAEERYGQGRGWDFGEEPRSRGRMGRGNGGDIQSYGWGRQSESYLARNPMEGAGYYQRGAEGRFQEPFRSQHPEMGDGPYSGKGPEGYQRSNDGIREDVCQRLQAHGWIDASKCKVKVEGGIVTLEGSVASREEKRLANDVAESVSGVRDVRNLLELRTEDRSESAAGSSMASPGEMGAASRRGSQRGANAHA
jgi:hypothetical protein